MNGGGSRRVFVDTNVLLYAFDSRAGMKQGRARQWLSALWAPDVGRLSWQVLNEFYFNAVRKMHMPTADARSLVEAYALWKPVGVGFGIVQHAWYWMDRASLSYWDAMIVAAAETAGCDFLLSEDFQTGRDFDSVRVISPFERMPVDFGYSPEPHA